MPSYQLYERIRKELRLAGAAVTDTQFSADIAITAFLPEDGEKSIELVYGTQLGNR